MNLCNIKAIFFDADDTIVDHKQCEKKALEYLFDNIQKEYKQQYQDIFRPLDRSLWNSVANNTNPVPKEDIPEYRFKEFFKKINLEYSNYKEANKLFKKGLADAVALTQNAYDIIKYLYEKKYKICVVTNGLVELQVPRIRNSQISEYISEIIVSEEVGINKPNPKIFNVLLNKLSLKPSQVIMIGNSIEEDIKGAQNANIQTIWYNPSQCINHTQIIPNYQIGNLLELKEIL